MKNEKKYYLNIIYTLLCFLILISAITYYFDPLQVLNKTNYSIDDSRKINYGIARNYEYDLCIVGTSTSENILKKDLKSILKLEGVNLSIPGSTNYEQRKLLEVILNEKKAKTIIYGLDVFSFNSKIDEVRVKNPEYIEKFSLINSLKYLMNFESLKNIVNSKKDKNWIETHGYWGDIVGEFSKERTKDLGNVQNEVMIQFFIEKYALKKMKKNFDSFFKIIDSNSDVKYIIYFPPYASIFWNLANEYENIDIILDFKEYVYSKLENKTNIEIHDFHFDYSVVENLDNYKDMVHYSPDINKKIILDIKSKKYLSDLKKFENEKKKFIKKLERWEKMFKNKKS